MKTKKNMNFAFLSKCLSVRLKPMHRVWTGRAENCYQQDHCRVLREPMMLQLQLQRLIFHLNRLRAIFGDDAFASLPTTGRRLVGESGSTLKKLKIQSGLHFVLTVNHVAQRGEPSEVMLRQQWVNLILAVAKWGDVIPRGGIKPCYHTFSNELNRLHAICIVEKKS